MNILNIIKEESQIFSEKTAIIEIQKAMAYMPMHKYIQAVPAHTLQNRTLYVNKGSSGHGIISPKNVKVLKLFNNEDKQGIQDYINRELINRGYIDKPLNEETNNDYDDINIIYQYETIYGWITPDYNFIKVPFGGHELIAYKYFKDTEDPVNTAIRNGWVRLSKSHNSEINLDLYDENQIKTILLKIFKRYVDTILNVNSYDDIYFFIHVLKSRKNINISSDGIIRVNGNLSRVDLDKYLKYNVQSLNENIVNLINNEIIRFINEDMDVDDWYDIKNNLSIEIFQMINNKEHVKFDLIPKLQYQRALQEFVKYGGFMRFPTSKIIEWKDLILENIAKLEVLTSIGGHAQWFPCEEFLDVFDITSEYTTGQMDLFTNQEQVYVKKGEFSQWMTMKYKETGDKRYTGGCSYDVAYEFLDEVKNMDDYLPLFSNGQWVLSDYGLKPLYEIGQEMVATSSPEELIVLINRALDVTHQRSDLAELFIEGGSASLSAISNGQLVH
jgi:hypothetical protein